MNRFKRELRKHGVKLECDYPFLPYNGIETVVVDSENAIVSTYHVSAGCGRIKANRDFTIENFRETVRFFSETQMEIDLSRNIDGMLVTEVYDYLDGYCHDHKVICGGKEYTADDLFSILVDDDLTWDAKWKKKKVVKCSGCKYINNKISCANCRYRNIVEPDFDPTHGLEYLGW